MAVEISYDPYQMPDEPEVRPDIYLDGKPYMLEDFYKVTWEGLQTLEGQRKAEVWTIHMNNGETWTGLRSRIGGNSDILYEISFPG